MLLAGAALDLLFLGQQSLEVVVHGGLRHCRLGRRLTVHRAVRLGTGLGGLDRFGRLSGLAIGGRASWSAMPWAIRAASSSGCLISWMLSWTFGLCVILARSLRRRSASAPRRPMTIPGRAVWRSMRNRSRVRSTSMRLTAAASSWVIR